MSDLAITVDLVQHPIEGPSIGVTFGRKVKYFGLNPEKAKVFANHILELVQKIEQDVK